MFLEAIGIVAKIISVGLSIGLGFIAFSLLLSASVITAEWLIAWPLYTLRGKVPPTWKYLWDVAGTSGES